MRAADLLKINQHLVIRCAHCDREERLRAVEAVKLLGPETDIHQAARRMRCSRCGRRGRDGLITVRPCMIDFQAWQLHETVRTGRLEANFDPEEQLRTYARLCGGDLGGDGPVEAS